MFSGKYLEDAKQEIEICVVDANSMKSIISYMQMGLIDLTDFPLAALGDLAVSASYLQLSELVAQIEFTLDEILCLSNWMSVMTIAEDASLGKLETLAAAFGLFSFKSVKIEHIPSIQKLYWYLSHSYLDVDKEVNVFNFGFRWVSNAKESADALLIILGCLDIKVITTQEFREIQSILKPFENSLVAKMVDCLLGISDMNIEMSSVVINENKDLLCELYTEGVYNEVLNLVRSSKSRESNLTPCVSSELELQYLYTFDKESGFKKWLEVAERFVCGWDICPWGLNKLVVVTQEDSHGKTNFRYVSVWDTLRKEWMKHEVKVPGWTHAGVVVIDHQLYMIGMQVTVVYDLETRSYRQLLNLPGALLITTGCAHKGSLYVVGLAGIRDQGIIYRYETSGETEMWKQVLELENTCILPMVSLGDYIYFTKKHDTLMYRFRPDVETELRIEKCGFFSGFVAAMCCVGNKIVAFTQADHPNGQQNEALLSVEEWRDGEMAETLWSEKTNLCFDDFGCCSLAISMPPLNPATSQYARQHLERFTEAE